MFWENEGSREIQTILPTKCQMVYKLWVPAPYAQCANRPGINILHFGYIILLLEINGIKGDYQRNIT